MLENLAWLGPIFVTLITATATYLAVVRKASGRIVTTEAAALWKEAGSLRDVYRDEIARLRGMIREIEDRLELIESENQVLVDKNIALDREIAKLHEENEFLRRENLRLRLRLDDIEKAHNGQ